MRGRQLRLEGGALGKRLRRDVEYREALAYVVPLGIPLSEFLSWPEEDQDAALAFIRAKAEACPNCGTWPDQADEFEPTTIRCHLCEDTERVQADLDEERQRNPDGTRGVRVALMRGR